jgi:hypothetical protein
MKKHEIKLGNDYATILIYIFNRHGIVYTLKEQNNENSVIYVFDRDIDNIIDLLINEMMGNATTGSMNEYEKTLDSIINTFYTIKCESEEPDCKNGVRINGT